MSYEVTYPGTQSTETIRGSTALSPHASQMGSPLIKGTRFVQLLQTSKDFLSQEKGPQEGHVLQPHPVSQKCHLLGFKLASQVTSTLAPATGSEHTAAPGEVSPRVQRQRHSWLSDHKIPTTISGDMRGRVTGYREALGPALLKAISLIQGSILSFPITGRQNLFKLYGAHHLSHPAACLLGGRASSFPAPWFFACRPFPIPCA